MSDKGHHSTNKKIKGIRNGDFGNTELEENRHEIFSKIFHSLDEEKNNSMLVDGVGAGGRVFRRDEIVR